jgi:hypothetical protein
MLTCPHGQPGRIRGRGVHHLRPDHQPFYFFPGGKDIIYKAADDAGGSVAQARLEGDGRRREFLAEDEADTHGTMFD